MNLPTKHLRALLLGAVSVKVILRNDDRVGVPGLATIGSLKASRVATVDSKSLSEVGVSSLELDSKVIPRILLDSTTGAEVALVAGVDVGGGLSTSAAW